MKNRKKQRENRRKYSNSLYNASGCIDRTAHDAIENVSKEKKAERKNA